MTRLLLVRHAEPDGSVHGRVYGRLDPPLSAAGRARALELAEVLRAEQPAAVYTSPRVRARETAVPLGIEAVVHDDLREIDFGDLEGLEAGAAAMQYPHLATWYAAPAAVAFPGGESVAAVRGRVLLAVAEIVAAHGDDTVAIFTHSLPVRIVVADVLRLDPDGLFRFDIAYGSVSVAEWHDGEPFVRLVNGARI